jgi:uncharacterized repeat protein (TIGR03943 family)
VTPFDASCAVLASGLLALWMGLSDAMLKYLKPSMRPWLVLAGTVLVVVGICGLVYARRREASGRDEREPDGHEHHHRLGVGWLLTVPVVVTLILGSQSLGAFAAGRASSRALPLYSFDLEAYAQAQGDDIPTLQLVDVQIGARQRGNREFLARHTVRLEGFVTHNPSLGPGGFVLNRFLVSCCAADAVPIRIAMVDAGRVPAANRWVSVTARLEQDHALHAEVNASEVPETTMRVASIEPTDEPSAPYETLR